MKTLKYTLILLLVIASPLLQSCYEDKGNYDYSELGSVTIEQNYDIPESSSTQMVWYGGELKIVPIIKLNGLEESGLDFFWDCCVQNMQNPKFTELSRERNLSANITLTPGKYDVRFKATDKITGVSTYAYYNLTVNSLLDRSVLVLCKTGAGEYDIYTCPIDASRGLLVYQVGRDLYSVCNGRRLKDAEKLVYWNNTKSETLLWALQKNGGETLSAYDLNVHGDATTWFFETPSAIHPTNIYGESNGYEYFLLSDGGVHLINNKLGPPFKARAKAQVSDGSDYRINEAAYFCKQKARRYAFWDELNSRFLEWDYNAERLKPFTAKVTDFDPNNMQGMTPVYLGGGFDSGRSAGAKSYSFFEGNGEIHMFVFDGTSTTIFPKEHRVMPSSVKIKEASSILAFVSYDLIYYTVDNAIYVFDPNSPVNLTFPVYTDPDPEVRFLEMTCVNGYPNLFASAKKGDQYYVYRIYVDSSGDVSQPTTLRPNPVEALGPYPEIVDMEVLFKDY